MSPASSVSLLEVADHTLIRRIGAGSYGEVWLGRNVLGSHRAIKLVFRDAFDSERPYEREFNGILKYEPVSRTHPGLVDVLQVGRHQEAGYFYYIMELADDAGAAENTESGQPESGRRKNGAELSGPASLRDTPSRPAPKSNATYTPRTLKTELHKRGRLPARECVDLGIALANALDHLHQHGLVHRDIKPANVIFVEGQPLLADIGLVTDSDATRTTLGTEGYFPPEGGGSPQADMFSLGKVLYELATGWDRKEFPALPPDLATRPDRRELLELNEVITRACATDPARRYRSAAELRADLETIQSGRRLKSVRRQRVLKTAAMVLAIVAVAAGLAAFFRSKPPTTTQLLSVEDQTAGLTVEEKAAGFRPLFNGTDLQCWREQGLSGPTTNWGVQDGALVRLNSGKTSRSRLNFTGGFFPRDFELRFDWKAAPGSESGLFYLAGWIEYQIIDNALANDALASAGALAFVDGPTNALARRAGEWNEARILCQGPLIEHWLNGHLAARADLRQPETRDRLLAAEMTNYRRTFGDTATRSVYLRLQDNGSTVFYRRLMVRPLTVSATNHSLGSQAAK